MEGAVEEAIVNNETPATTEEMETNAKTKDVSNEISFETKTDAIDKIIEMEDEKVTLENIETDKRKEVENAGFDELKNVDNSNKELEMEPNVLNKLENAGSDELETGDNSSNQELFYTISAGFITKSDEFETLEHIKFCEKLPADSMCDSCNLVLWRPIKLKCGHVICDTCKISESETESHLSFNCPIDMESTLANEIESLESLHNEITQRTVHCLETECDWTGLLNEIDNHFQNCDKKKGTCHHCQEILFLSLLEDHIGNLCPNRHIKCIHCEFSVQFKSMESHDQVCQQKLVQCPNCCKEVEDKEKTVMIKQGELQNHLENECAERMVFCPFYHFSCDKKVKFKRIPQHLIKYSIVHLNSIGTSGKNSLELLEEQIRKMIAIKEKIKNNEKRIAELKMERGTQLLWKLENFKEMFDAALLGDHKDIVSEPFYSTSPYGYKFVLRLIFNVNNERMSGQFISLFISICDSPFNSLLSWPFKQKIFLHLINQKSDKHITHCFTPNAIKDNFPFIQRPTTERNPFFGIEKFTRCNIFQDGSQYVVNNTAFFKIVIEPHGIV